MIRQKATTLVFGLALAAMATKPRLAPTPPMGWNSWEALRKDVGENAINIQADALVQLGLRDGG
ncbi:MAG TPA: hypothetical protein VKB88_30025 [Bryobacteraceae bacterium]|nr:hypothetical protein [Bryobacteraceae bacterium]